MGSPPHVRADGVRRTRDRLSSEGFGEYELTEYQRTGTVQSFVSRRMKIFTKILFRAFHPRILHPNTEYDMT